MGTVAIAELFLLAALWGGSFLWLRVAAPVLGPVWLIELRVVLASLVLLPLMVRFNLMAEMRRHWRDLLIIGSLNSALPFLLFAFSALSLSAGFTAILNATTPLFGTVIAALWLREKMTIASILGSMLGFIGVVVLVGWEPIPFTLNFGLAVLSGLLGALMYAIAAPYTKLRLSGVSSLVLTTGSQLGAALLLLPALPFTIPQQTPSAFVIFSVLALAILSTSFAYVLYYRLIQNVGASKALTIAYLVPPSALLWGAIVLQEPITLSMLIGCGLVLLGTAIANGGVVPSASSARS
ncbi:MAG: DMT family transporter [Elainella sp. Prado103]|jgi:drug/metabolite transporter (DMT)-like permease|nr:DMT family transporter [Elainella sp. Prado103]